MDVELNQSKMDLQALASILQAAIAYAGRRRKPVLNIKNAFIHTCPHPPTSHNPSPHIFMQTAMTAFLPTPSIAMLQRKSHLMLHIQHVRLCPARNKQTPTITTETKTLCR